DDTEYFQECKYWLQNLYSKDDYRFVSGFLYEYEKNKNKFQIMIEFYFSKHFYKEIEALQRSRISDEFQAFRDA
ncbi:MAG: hypothetical protein JHC31_07950, partial [Sulfurihydrogenibium sp.]|nr:hypothetical protein [Sulfurihydrogenibium sp.]